MECRLFRSSCIYLFLFLLAILVFLDLHCYPTCLCHQIIQKSLFFCQSPDHDGLSPPFPLRAHPFSLLSSFPLDLRINSTSWSKDLIILPKSDLPFLHINSQFCPVILIEFVGQYIIFLPSFRKTCHMITHRKEECLIRCSCSQLLTDLLVDKPSHYRTKAVQEPASRLLFLEGHSICIL